MGNLGNLKLFDELIIDQMSFCRFSFSQWSTSRNRLLRLPSPRPKRGIDCHLEQVWGEASSRTTTGELPQLWGHMGGPRGVTTAPTSAKLPPLLRHVAGKQV